MPDPPPDYYNRLLEQRRAEYAAKGLSKVPPDFFTSTTRYVASLHEILERETRENPTSKKVEMTRTTYQRALASARDVLEARLGKISHLAVQHVNLGGEPANLLPEERALYDALVRDLSGFRRTSAPFLEPASGSSAPSPAAPPAAPGGTASMNPRPLAASPPPPSTAAPPPSPPSYPPPAPAVRAASPPSSPPSSVAPPSGPSSPPPTAVIRVLQDQPALALPQETIELRKEDLIVLPVEKAQLLVHARIAERVDVQPRAKVT